MVEVLSAAGVVQSRRLDVGVRMRCNPDIRPCRGDCQGIESGPQLRVGYQSTGRIPVAEAAPRTPPGEAGLRRVAPSKSGHTVKIPELRQNPARDAFPLLLSQTGGSTSGDSFGKDEPASAVDEFTCRVEVTGVACGFSNHVQDDFPQILNSPVTEEIVGPGGRCGV